MIIPNIDENCLSSPVAAGSFVPASIHIVTAPEHDRDEHHGVDRDEHHGADQDDHHGVDHDGEKKIIAIMSFLQRMDFTEATVSS